MLLIGLGTLTAQSPNQVPVQASDDTLAKITTLRDAFVARVHAAGFQCPLAPPTIVVEDVPSFGQYDPETNSLHTSAWVLLKPQERAFFFQLAGPGADEPAARNTFEYAAHGWIFVHELGHWWQACRNVSAAGNPYRLENGANRIALAYWREVDPTIPTRMMGLFQSVLDHAPSPVPSGEKVESYFNKNYETLGPRPAYPWFQSRMSIDASQESPQPTFAQALASTKN